MSHRIAQVQIMGEMTSASGATITLDGSKSHQYRSILGANANIVLTNVKPNDHFEIEVTQDNVGGRTVSFPASTTVVGSIDSDPNAKSIIFIRTDGSNHVAYILKKQGGGTPHLQNIASVGALRTLRNGSNLEPGVFYRIPYSRGTVTGAFVTVYATAVNKLSKSASVETTFDADTAWRADYDLTDNRLSMMQDNRQNKIYGKTEVDQFPRGLTRYTRVTVEEDANVTWNTANTLTVTNVTFKQQCVVELTTATGSIVSSTFMSRARQYYNGSVLTIQYTTFAEDAYGLCRNLARFDSYYNRFGSTIRLYGYNNADQMRFWYSDFNSTALIRAYAGILQIQYSNISSRSEIRQYGTGTCRIRYTNMLSFSKLYNRSNNARYFDYCTLKSNSTIQTLATNTANGTVSQADLSRSTLEIAGTTGNVTYIHLSQFSRLRTQGGTPVRVMVQSYAYLDLAGYNATNVTLIGRITKTLTANNTNRSEVLNNGLV